MLYYSGIHIIISKQKVYEMSPCVTNMNEIQIIETRLFDLVMCQIDR